MKAQKEKSGFTSGKRKQQRQKNTLSTRNDGKKKAPKPKKNWAAFKKELNRAEKNIKNLSKQKKSQIFRLQAELEAEVKRLRQPVLDLEAARDAKMLVFKRETEKLLKLEKPVVDGLNGAIKLGEAVNAKFAMLGTVDPQLKNPALFYVPFYATCYQAGSSRRFIYVPPCQASAEGFTAKLKGALGRSKIRRLLFPVSKPYPLQSATSKPSPNATPSWTPKSWS